MPDVTKMADFGIGAAAGVLIETVKLIYGTVKVSELRR